MTFLGKYMDLHQYLCLYFQLCTHICTKLEIPRTRRAIRDRLIWNVYLLTEAKHLHTFQNMQFTLQNYMYELLRSTVQLPFTRFYFVRDREVHITTWPLNRLCFVRSFTRLGISSRFNFLTNISLSYRFVRVSWVKKAACLPHGG